jgi:hypothetical protein
MNKEEARAELIRTGHTYRRNLGWVRDDRLQELLRKGDLVAVEDDVFYTTGSDINAIYAYVTGRRNFMSNSATTSQTDKVKKGHKGALSELSEM